MYFLKRIQVTLSLHGGVVSEPKYVQYPLSSKPAKELIRFLIRENKSEIYRQTAKAMR